MSSDLFDRSQIRRNFSRSAGSYAAAAQLQTHVRDELLQSLAYRDDPGLALPSPHVVLDLGTGLGEAAAAMLQRWPQAQVVALDVALPMLRLHASTARGWRLRKPNTPQRICADARRLPLPDASVDVVFSNLCLQWIDDLPAQLAELRRVMKPQGMLLFTSFGPATLRELHDAFAMADTAPHVSPFASIAQLGDALMLAGFRDPVLDRDIYPEHYPDLPALMRHLRALGATNALTARRASLTGKSRFARAAQAYEELREPEGLPVTWEVISAMAWAPQPGVPQRLGGVEIAGFPAAAIPVRRR